MAVGKVKRFEGNSKSDDLSSEKNRLGFSHKGKKTPSRIPGDFQKRKSLPEPSSLSNFLALVVISLCRKVLLIETSVKIGLYIVLVTVGSMISDVLPVPLSFFSNKRNFLNVYFVKLGWGWTLVMLCPFVCLTSYVYTCCNVKQTLRHGTRLVVATFWWYICTKTFVYVQDSTSICTDNTFIEKTDCLQAGHSWLGFDISGHIFILIHALLTISEEVKIFKYWTRLDDILKRETTAELKRLTSAEIDNAVWFHKAFSPFIKLIFVALTILCLIWNVMLVSTTIYQFHTLVQKIYGLCAAVACWFVSYQLLFATKSTVLPAQPGECQLKFMKPPLMPQYRKH